MFKYGYSQSSYIRQLIYDYRSCRFLHSCYANQLVLPRVCTAIAGRSFSIAAPTIWNHLPSFVTNCASVAIFRRHLKTRLFTEHRQSCWSQLQPASPNHVLAVNYSAVIQMRRLIDCVHDYEWIWGYQLWGININSTGLRGMRWNFTRAGLILQLEEIVFLKEWSITGII